MAEDLKRGALRKGVNRAGFRYSHSEPDALPALSFVLSRLDQLLSAPAIDLRELVRTVWNDPSIAARVLYRAMLEKVGDLPTRSEAVLLVGAKALREIVVSTPEFHSTDPGSAQFVALLRHCQTVSLLSERFALAMGTGSAEHAAMLGLFHHIQPIPSALGSRLEESLSDWDGPTLWQIVGAADRVANCCGYGADDDLQFSQQWSKRFPGFHSIAFTSNTF